MNGVLVLVVRLFSKFIIGQRLLKMAVYAAFEISIAFFHRVQLKDLWMDGVVVVVAKFINDVNFLKRICCHCSVFYLPLPRCDK